MNAADFLFDAVGLLGVGCFLLAFALLQAEKVKAGGLDYLFLNFGGALLVIVSLLWKWNLPAFVLEVA